MVYGLSLAFLAFPVQVGLCVYQQELFSDNYMEMSRIAFNEIYFSLNITKCPLAIAIANYKCLPSVKYNLNHIITSIVRGVIIESDHLESFWLFWLFYTIKMVSTQHLSNNGKNWQKVSYQKILLAW